MWDKQQERRKVPLIIIHNGLYKRNKLGNDYRWWVTPVDVVIEVCLCKTINWHTTR